MVAVNRFMSEPVSAASAISADLLQSDFFTLLGVPKRFGLVQADLDSRFREMQRAVHPDRFAASDDASRRASMMLATRINEGYQTLRSPLKRASYLLHLAGVDVGAESNTAMPPEFLMQQMLWREQVADARAENDLPNLTHIQTEISEEIRDAYDALGAALDGAADLNVAAETIRRLMFLEKLVDEIDNTLFDLDDL